MVELAREQGLKQEQKPETAQTLSAALSGLLVVNSRITGEPLNFQGPVSALTDILLGRNPNHASNPSANHNLKELQKTLSWLKGLVEDRLAQGSQGNGSLQ